MKTLILAMIVALLLGCGSKPQAGEPHSDLFGDWHFMGLWCDDSQCLPYDFKSCGEPISEIHFDLTGYKANVAGKSHLLSTSLSPKIYFQPAIMGMDWLTVSHEDKDQMVLSHLMGCGWRFERR